MPSITDIFKMVKSVIKENDLIPITKLYTRFGKTNDKLNINISALPDKNKINEILNKYGLSADKFYILNNENTFDRFCYYDKKFVFLSFPCFDEATFELYQLKSKIETYSKKVKELEDNKNYEAIFYFMDNKIQAFTFIKYFNTIPDNEKYNIFEHIYVNSEYGFEMFTKDFIIKVLDYYPKENYDKIKKLSDNDNIIIYRGENSESSSIQNALSWTTNKKIAYFFASRYSGEGKVYKAKINKENVKAYIDYGEDEILAFYKDIKDIKTMEKIPRKIGTSELTKEEFYNRLIINYRSALDRFCFPEKFYPKSIHGYLHSKRVLFLSLVISNYKKLSGRDKTILSFCSLLHDIGRDNDNEDDLHGKKSWDFIIKTYIYNAINNESDKEIAKFIIENHCINDEFALKNLDNYKIKNKNRVIKLFNIFKDADALDRIRLGKKDLDASQLRNDISKSLIKLSEELLQYLQ